MALPAAAEHPSARPTANPPASLEPVTFVESGLIPGWAWTISVLGNGGSPIANGSSNTSTLVLDLPGGASPVAYSGSAAASGFGRTAWSTEVGLSPVAVAVVFTTPETLFFLERGLPVGTAWTVRIQEGSWSSSVTSGNSSAIFSTLNSGPGFLNYTVSAFDFNAVPSKGTYTSPGPGAVSIEFTPVNGTFRVSVSPGAATLDVGGRAVVVGANGTTALSLSPGVYSVEATAPGYLPYFNNVSVTSAVNASLAIALVAVPSTPAPAVNPAAWAAIGLLASLAVIFLLIALGYRSRAHRPAPRELEPASSVLPRNEDPGSGERPRGR